MECYELARLTQLFGIYYYYIPITQGPACVRLLGRVAPLARDCDKQTNKPPPRHQRFVRWQCSECLRAFQSLRRVFEAVLRSLQGIAERFENSLLEHLGRSNERDGQRAALGEVLSPHQRGNIRATVPRGELSSPAHVTLLESARGGDAVTWDSSGSLLGLTVCHFEI